MDREFSWQLRSNRQAPLEFSTLPLVRTLGLV